MSIRKAIYDLLNNFEADVYPFIAPQELSDPYVVFSVRIEPLRTQDGITVTDAYLTIDIYANDLPLCGSLASTMYQGLEAATGGYGSGSSRETLHICNWTGEDGTYIPELDKYNITQEYTLRFI